MARFSFRGLGLSTILRSAAAVLEASIRIRVQRFDRVAEWAVAGPVRLPLTFGPIEDDCRAVLGWCRKVPWRALCMEQSVATARLLARRGESITIFYGAATAVESLIAHVWVRSGEIPIVGCENAHEFVVLSRFTNVSSSSSVHASLYKEGSEES